MFISIISSTQPPFAKPWGNYLLDKIVETTSPQSISWLPQTLGWKVLAMVLLLLLVKKSYQAYKNYQDNAYRREALTWLNQCQKANDINLYKQLPALLRKTALSAFKRTDVSQLHGSSWEQWLDQQCQQTSFTLTCPNILHQLAFMPTKQNALPSAQYQTLITQITLWVKYHRRQDA